MELEALRSVFSGQHRPIALGATKSHIGHSEGASGIMSCMKSLLGMQKATMPPNLHLKMLVGIHEWANIPSTVTCLAEGCLHSGVSSFGFGGTLCHAILEVKSHSMLESSDMEQKRSPNRFLQKHPLLGEQLETQRLGSFEFQSCIDLAGQHLYLKGHRVDGRVIFPAEAYLEMMFAMARLGATQGGSPATHLEEVRFRRMHSLPSSEPVYSKMSLEGNRWSLIVSSGSEKLATCQIVTDAPTETVHQRAFPAEDALLQLSNEDIHRLWPEYGESFRLIQEVQVFDRVAWGRIQATSISFDCFAVSPGLMDAALQVLASALEASHTPETAPLSGSLVPTRIGSVILRGVLPPCQVYEACAWWVDGFRGNVELLLDRYPVAVMLDCEFHRLPKREPRAKVVPQVPELETLVPFFKELRPLRESSLPCLVPSGVGSAIVCRRDQRDEWCEFEIEAESTQRVNEVMQQLKRFGDAPVIVQYSPCQTDGVNLPLEVEVLCRQLLTFAQAISEARLNVINVVVTTRGAVCVPSAPSAIHLAHSALNGMCRSLRAEKPSWNVMQLDLEQASSHAWTTELFDLHAEPLVVLRNGKLFGLRLQQAPSTRDAFQPKASDHFLITGGLGGGSPSSRLLFLFFSRNKRASFFHVSYALRRQPTFGQNSVFRARKNDKWKSGC